MGVDQNGHADQLGDLLSALSLLNEIPDLLDSLRRKLYASSISWELRGELFGLYHLVSPLEQLLCLFGDRSFLDGVARPSDGLKLKFMNTSAQVKSWQECVLGRRRC